MNFGKFFNIFKYSKLDSIESIKSRSFADFKANLDSIKSANSIKSTDSIKQKSQKAHKQGAFTMLELIFILAILGILAAIAVPKISASREDARLVALRADLSALRSSLPAYFLAQGSGSFLSAINLNASAWNIGEFSISSKLQSNGQSCLNANLVDENGATATNADSVRILIITAAVAGNENGDTCEKFIFQTALNPNAPEQIPLLSASMNF